MPITANINRHPEIENQAETAAPHAEEMKATIDLAIGNAVSVKAIVRTTSAGLIAQRCSQPPCCCRPLRSQKRL